MVTNFHDQPLPEFLNVQIPRTYLDLLHQNLENGVGELFLDTSQVDDPGVGTTKQYCTLLYPVLISKHMVH